MRKWLGRLAMSLIILGVWLVWEGYRVLDGRVPGAPGWRAWALFAGGVALFVAGLAGVRERHRPPGGEI